MFLNPKSPTKAPSSSGTCVDTTGWEDIYGQGCEWYQENDEPGCHNVGEMGPAAENCCYCKEKGTMPVGLIVFGDKSHTDLHGVLSLTPIIFTFTFFNRAARNNPRFWRPFTYIPNLSYGKGTANQTPTKDKIQDEHTCISFAFKSLRKISEEKGFRLVVLGKEVHVKVWIHFFIGDTEGNNKWLGQYPGNKEGVQRPYRDCKCTWQMLSHISFDLSRREDSKYIGEIMR